MDLCTSREVMAIKTIENGGHFPKCHASKCYTSRKFTSRRSLSFYVRIIDRLTAREKLKWRRRLSGKVDDTIEEEAVYLF